MAEYRVGRWPVGFAPPLRRPSSLPLNPRSRWTSGGRSVRREGDSRRRIRHTPGPSSAAMQHGDRRLRAASAHRRTWQRGRPLLHSNRRGAADDRFAPRAGSERTTASATWGRSGSGPIYARPHDRFPMMWITAGPHARWPLYPFGTRNPRADALAGHVERGSRQQLPQPQGIRKMELGGLEPPTSWVRSRRSPN